MEKSKTSPLFLTFKSAEKALDDMSQKIVSCIKAAPCERPFNLAVSGGGTAAKLFARWKEHYAEADFWQRLNVFWVDERCVPAQSEESNYGEACRILFDLLPEPPQIFPIDGSAPPDEEAEAYGKTLKQQLPLENGVPRFDLIILGFGPDAHTASIFPYNMELLTDSRLCAPSAHPVSHQKRVTLTGKVILNHTPLFVPIIGSGKEDLLRLLQSDELNSAATPATYVLQHADNATLWIGE